MNDPATGWSDERVELLKKLWAEGLSASQIATTMGGITRNAVIGKVHRLGLSGRAKSTTTAAPQKPRKAAQPAPAPRVTAAAVRQAAPIVQGNTALVMEVQAEVAPVILQDLRTETEVVIPISERVSIMDLRENMCRWPLGDPTTSEFRFCGNRTTPGQPYCNHHCRIAYQPPDRRRR